MILNILIGLSALSIIIGAQYGILKWFEHQQYMKRQLQKYELSEKFNHIRHNMERDRQNSKVESDK